MQKLVVDQTVVSHSEKPTEAGQEALHKKAKGVCKQRGRQSWK